MNRNYISKTAVVAESASLTPPVRILNAWIKKRTALGKFSFINDGTTIYPDTVLGSYCSIGKNCEVGAFDHPVNWLSTSPIQYNLKQHFPEHIGIFSQVTLERTEKTTIGNDVWIASLSLIKRGVTIGDGAIVAAGAVVIADVPPYAIVGGVPAKILKYRFEPEIIKDLLALKWWDRPTEELKHLSWKDVKAVIKQLKFNDLKKNLLSGEKPEALVTAETPESNDFYKRFSYRLLENGISEKSTESILNALSHPFVKYKWDDIYDAEIFNNKIEHLFKLLKPMEENGTFDFKVINALFKTKE